MLRVWTFALLLLSGCSVVFVQSPHVVEGRVECTREFTLPLVDAAVGVVGIATPFIMEALRDRSTQNAPTIVYGAMWVTGAAYAVSSILGITKVKRCRRTVSAAALSQPAPAAPIAPTSDAPPPEPPAP